MVRLGKVGTSDDKVGAEHCTGGETEAGWEGGTGHQLGTVVDVEVGSRDEGKDFKFALYICELYGGKGDKLLVWENHGCQGNLRCSY